MKNIYLFLILVFLYFVGCDKIPDNVVDNKISSIQALQITAPAEFSYNVFDSSFTTSVKFSDGTNIKSVWVDVFSPKDEKVNSEPLLLRDDGIFSNGDMLRGDNIFSSKVPFSEKYSSGNYQLKYYVSDLKDNSIFIGTHALTYFSQPVNYPPVISNLIMPDTVSVDESFTFTLKVTDQNGYNDIKRVFFRYYRTDGSVSNDFFMVDDGSSILDDSVAGDGVFSFRNHFTSEAKGQSRKFEFQAIDQRDSLSSIITHIIYIK